MPFESPHHSLSPPPLGVFSQFQLPDIGHILFSLQGALTTDCTRPSYPCAKCSFIIALLTYPSNAFRR